MRRANLHQVICRASLALRAAVSEVELAGADFFAVRVPDEAHPVWVAFTEDRGRGRGFVALRGADALQRIMARATGDGDPDSEEDVDSLTLTFDHIDALPEPAKHILRSARFKPGPDGIAPVLLARAPGGLRRRPSNRELNILCMVIQAILLAAERELITPESVSAEGGPLTLVVSGDFQDPTLDAARGLGMGKALSKPPPQPTLAIDRSSLENLARLDACWLVDCPAAPFVIEEQRGLSTRLLLVVDRKSGQLLDGAPVSGQRWAYAAALRVFDVVRGETEPSGARGLPQQLLCVSRELAELMCPELRALGVDCRHEPAAWSGIEPAFDALVHKLLCDDDR